MKRALLPCILGVVAIGATVRVASAAGSVAVYVGYADGIRTSGNSFFPNPWDGSAGVTFLGAGTNYDSGAIMFVNNTAANITLDQGFHVDGFHNGADFQLWDSLIGASGTVITPGHKLILTQTADNNFDSSDQPILGQGSKTSDQPVIHAGFDGNAFNTYVDTKQVLNTGGFDLASLGTNEALNWRLIGTTGIENPGGAVPEPGVVGLLASGIVCGGSLILRRRARK